MVSNNYFFYKPKKSPHIFIVLLLCISYALSGLAAQQQPPDAAKPPVDDLVLVPAGKFIMGGDKVEKSNMAGEFGNVKPWYLDEHPKHSVKLPAYYIEEHEVTNKQYLDYVAYSNIDPPDHWLTNGYILRAKIEALNSVDVEKLRKLAANVFKIDKDTRRMGKEELLTDIKEKLAYMDNLPVTYVTWKQASNYCQWVGLRLPSEEEWEKAARGSKGQEFPWGNEFKKHMSNTGSEQWDMGAAPIESYPTDKSPYGIYDLAGNVSEWTADWYDAYPGSDYSSKAFGKNFKVAKGAGWSGGAGHYALQLFQRGAYRSNLPPDQKFDDVGFRCAADDTPAIHARLSHEQQHHTEVGSNE
jgi:formylglycine-generating enzyme required for sulfatase activity